VFIGTVVLGEHGEGSFSSFGVQLRTPFDLLRSVIAMLGPSEKPKLLPPFRWAPPFLANAPLAMKSRSLKAGSPDTQRT